MSNIVFGQDLWYNTGRFRSVVGLDNVSISPTLLGTQFNNIDPPNFEYSNALHISSDQNGSLTGIIAPSPPFSKLVYLVNEGNKNIKLANNDPGSLAANRFLLAADVNMSPNGCVFLKYDPLNLRWRATEIA